MRLDQKIKELTDELKNLNIRSVPVENRPDVKKYQTGLLIEKSVLEASLVSGDTEKVWRMAFDQLQSRRPPNQQQGAIALPATDIGNAQARLRVETKHFVWRYCYDEYEGILLDAANTVSGLIGPQGFGKTVLLRYLHAKYIFSDVYFVINVPSMRVDANLVHASERIRAGFYRTCALRGLDYHEFGDSAIVTLSHLIVMIKNYAEGENLALLIIIDQLRVGDDFSPLFDAINYGLQYSNKPHKVIVSSSTSRTTRDVFHPFANHVRFQNFTTPAEAQALFLPNCNVTLQDLTGISFLEAVRRTRSGTHKSLAADVLEYWTTYIGDSATELCKAEHMFVFHGVLLKESFSDDILLSSAIDGDTFGFHVDGQDRRLLEKRPGLALGLFGEVEEHGTNVRGIPIFHGEQLFFSRFAPKDDGKYP